MKSVICILVEVETDADENLTEFRAEQALRAAGFAFITAGLRSDSSLEECDKLLREENDTTIRLRYGAA